MKNFAIVQYTMASFASKLLNKDIASFKLPFEIAESAKEMCVELSYHASVEEAQESLRYLLDLLVNYGDNTDRNICVMRDLTHSALTNYYIR